MNLNKHVCYLDQTIENDKVPITDKCNTIIKQSTP